MQLSRAKLFVICLFAVLQTGCLYTHVRAPMDRNFDNTELGAREGRSSIHTVLWLVSWGDGGTKAAAEKGEMTVIRHADSELRLFIFGLYSRMTTIVYGD